MSTMEHNMEVDALSKAGIQLACGQWEILEFQDGEQFEYYHKPFHEGTEIIDDLPT
jgi:hypothetical protein